MYITDSQLILFQIIFYIYQRFVILCNIKNRELYNTIEYNKQYYLILWQD